MKAKQSTLEISVRPGALDAASGVGRNRYPLETGGIVIGWREPDRILIDRFLEVPDPRARPTAFSRRRGPAQVALDEVLNSAVDDRFGYIGEWHTHPADQGPSWQDRREIRSVARTLGKPVVLVVLSTTDGSVWTPHVLTASGRARAVAQLIEEQA